MGLIKPGIYEEFKYAGHWWIPEDDNNKVSGTIIFSKNGIRLELIGSIDGLNAWEDGTDENKFDVIHGECEEGPVSLLDGFQINKRSGYITTSILAFNKMIIGKHINPNEELKIKKLILHFTNLESWLKYHPFENMYGDEFGTKVSHVDVFEIYVESIKAKIKSNYIISSNDKLYQKTGYNYKPEIEIESNEYKNLAWFEEQSYKLRSFFSILMDSPIFIESMSFNDDRRTRIYIYFLPHKNYKKEKISRYEHINVDLPKIKQIISKLLNNWFNSKVESTHSNYLRNIYNSNNLTLEEIFLNYAKALESFHRNFTEGNGFHINVDQYADIVGKMIKAVEGEISKELKTKLIGTLKHANQYGFQRRIKEVIRLLPEEYRELILGGQKLGKMADQIRNNRDYYTHFGEVPKDLYSFEQLLFIKDKLKATLLYLILLELGLDEKLILESIFEGYGLIERLQMANGKF